MIQAVSNDLTLHRPSFPDYRDNYRQTVVIPAREAAEAARQAELAAQAQAQPQVAYAAPQGVIQLIYKWAAYYGVSADWLKGVASCESGFRANAQNLNYYAGGYPTGVFQFLPGTFARYSALAGFSGDIWNADDNIHAAAYAFSHGGSGEWECN